MAKGFGTNASKSPGSRKAAAKRQEEQAITSRSVKPEVAIKGSIQQDLLQNQEQQALAWEAGVYNPISAEAERDARVLEGEEEDWLFLANEIGWLHVVDALDAIYLTAPPPDFDERQADWYVRPDLSTFLDEPELLREVVKKYPIPQALLTETLLQRTQAIGWSAQETEAFIRDTVDNSWDGLQMADYVFLLLTLQHEVE
ncbi:hypothetical protein [Leptolyngbya sp. FACHB-16]|uniref:hypothetical protein n=1 Tax=unclassified Leptolyngbya TaxID=2650499 RepID=UPI00168835A0|nr:hypothetical protein [Leptolyngbya sp. FACHB-16]MBD2156906.1 hypothetical protein [Leptolyngbya sp. FACHB-16]